MDRLPPLETDSLEAWRSRQVARREGRQTKPPLAAAELAPAIRAQNERRTQTEDPSFQEAAIAEVLRATDLIEQLAEIGPIEPDQIRLYTGAVRETLASIKTKGKVRQSDVLARMRECVDSMVERQTGIRPLPDAIRSCR
jgi:hypothetical protein